MDSKQWVGSDGEPVAYRIVSQDGSHAAVVMPLPSGKIDIQLWLYNKAGGARVIEQLEIEDVPLHVVLDDISSAVWGMRRDPTHQVYDATLGRVVTRRKGQ